MTHMARVLQRSAQEKSSTRQEDNELTLKQASEQINNRRL